MAQNKLKKKVETLTNVVRQLIKEIQTNASIAQGTLTAFQLYIGGVHSVKAKSFHKN